MIKEGKYMEHDVADYLCWYSNSKMGKPMDYAQLNYILSYIVAEYKKETGVNLLWNCDIECWSTGFIFPELFYFTAYRSPSNPLKPIDTVIYPNIYTRGDVLSRDDKIFITELLTLLIDVPKVVLIEEMRSMSLYKERYVEGYRNSVTEEELANEFIKNKWIDRRK